MGIFNGTEILFSFLGIFLTLLVFCLIYLRRVYIFRWHSTLLASLGIFLAVWTLAWFVSSIQEGEPQAANMGLLVFGVPILIIFGITKRMVTKRLVSEDGEAETEAEDEVDTETV